jgi:hypothetical protein
VIETKPEWRATEMKTTSELLKLHVTVGNKLDSAASDHETMKWLLKRGGPFGRNSRPATPRPSPNRSASRP